MHPESVTNPCSVLLLAQLYCRRRAAHRTAVGSAGCSDWTAPANPARWWRSFCTADKSRVAPRCVRVCRRAPGEVVSRGRWSCHLGRAGTVAAGTPTGLPRLNVVFRLWQCDKQNHGWREGPPLTVAC